MLRKLAILLFLLIPTMTFGQQFPAYEVALSRVQFESAVTITKEKVYWDYYNKDMQDSLLTGFEANSLALDDLDRGLMSANVKGFYVTKIKGDNSSFHSFLNFESPTDLVIDLNEFYWTMEIKERLVSHQMWRSFYRKVWSQSKVGWCWEKVISVRIR